LEPTESSPQTSEPVVEKVAAQVKPVEFDVDTAQEVVFKPNPGPQTDFLSASEREVLYGGAAGGGKSYAMLADPLHGLNDPNFSGLLVRHTTEELRELIQKSQELYPKAVPGIKWSERKSQWISPRGGRLWISGLKEKVSGLVQGVVDFGCRTWTKTWTLLVTKVKRLTGSGSTN